MIRELGSSWFRRILVLTLASIPHLASPLAAQAAPPATDSVAGVYNVEQAVLIPLDQAVQTANTDITRLRIEKWKTDTSQKQQAQTYANSVQRNITAALPTLVAAVRANPQNLSANFQLYRNLNALYEVMLNLGDSAGAFGAKQDYQAISQDVAALDNARRSLGDYVDRLAIQKDADLARFRSGRGSTSASAVPAATPTPKRVIIDDTQPAPAKKRSTSTKKPSAAIPPKE